MNSVVHKRRVELNRRQSRAELDQLPNDLSGLRASAQKDIEYFQHHVMLTQARPVVRVRYLREAYQASGNEPVRITMDTDLAHAITLNATLDHGSGHWTETRLNGTIVEVKFTERYPWWVQDFIRTFGMSQRAVPKYVFSIDHMLLEGRATALALGGVTLPPRRA